MLAKDDSTEKVTKGKTTALVLVTPGEIEKKFPQISKQMAEWEAYSMSIAINDGDQLSAAENTASIVHNNIKSIEEIRKVYKQPYLDACTAIDGHAKTITDKLTQVKKRIATAIANYKTIQTAALSAQRDKQIEEINKIAEEKRNEMARLNRIQQQLYARIYGGFWIDAAGVRQTSAGCVVEKDCDDLRNVIATKVPKSTTFVHFKNQYEEMILDTTKKLAAYQVNLHNLHGDSSLLKKEALEKINEAKTDATISIAETTEDLSKTIEKSVQKEVKTFDKTIADSHKGVKKILKFVVTEADKIPRDFLKIDEDAVRNYMNENNDQIKLALTENRESIPGIKFYVEDVYATK